MHRFPTLVFALLALVLTAPLHAQNNEPDHPLLIVTGEAQVSVKPDRAIVRLGAVAQANNAAAAQDQVNQIMQRAIEAIGDQDIPKSKMSTAGISLSPVYSRPPRPEPRPRGEVGPDHPDSQEPRIVGYRASNTLRIEVDNLSKVGPVIDAGVKSGANHIESVSFGLKDDKDARSRALTAAAREAQDKAQALAKAMNVELGTIWRLDEQHVGVMHAGMDRGVRMMAMEAAPTPVEPGEVIVNASVRVQYRLDD